MEQEPPFSLTTSRGFEAWLQSTGGSLALTTYQSGKVFLLGHQVDGKLHLSERSFPRCMGVSVAPDGQEILLATRYQVLRFRNMLGPGETGPTGGDSLFVPRQSWFTGDLDTHDIAFGTNGRPLFVATQFNCLAEVSEQASFREVWRPPFISGLVPEDRCHLNGMAVQDGKARFVTVVAKSDVVDGWRDHRVAGGVVLDVVSKEVVCHGLSMPHSPRLHDGRLWVLNSGQGEFGWIDQATGKFEAVAFCPGYARGLSFVNGYAVIGLSLPRAGNTFGGLPLDDALEAKGGEARCGFLAIDLKTGATAAWGRVEGVIRELFDIAFVPKTQKPVIIGFKTDEIMRLISVE